MERWILSGMKPGKATLHFKAELLFSMMALAHLQFSVHITKTLLISYYVSVQRFLSLFDIAPVNFAQWPPTHEAEFRAII